MSNRNMRNKISEIMVKHFMPARQVAISEIAKLVNEENGELAIQSMMHIQQNERKRIEEGALEILEEYFPKLNQDDTTKPSGNGRGGVMSFYGLLVTKLLRDE